MTGTSKQSHRVLLGQIGPAHGIRGDVQLRSYTGDPSAIASYGPLSDALGQRSFTLKIVRVTAKGIIAHINGCDDRTSAEQLKGTDLYVDRDRLPPPTEAEFYHADLIGLKAVTTTGAPYGVVVDVHNFGAGDILELRLAHSSADVKSDTAYVPFSKTAVPDIDLDTRTLVVDPPAVVGDTDDGDNETADNT